MRTPAPPPRAFRRPLRSRPERDAPSARPCIPDGLLVRSPAASLPVRGSGLRLSGRQQPHCGFGTFSARFQPAVASGSLTSQIGAQLFAGLVRTGKDGPIPYLAESWEIDSQAKRFRFHLRKGATFHDGTPITANDVAFSIRAAQRHHPFRSMLEAVDKVVPVDDLTLDLETSIPQPALLKCFIPALVPVLPAHIYGDGTPIDTHPANLRAVGSGPFRLASLEEGKNIVLERYKGFFLPGKPRLDRITFRVYWDQNEIPLAIMQGEADLYAFSSLSDEERIFRSSPAIEVTRDEFSLLHPFALLTFNVRNPIFPLARSPQGPRHEHRQ